MDKEFDWLKGDRLSSIDAFSFAETEDMFALLELAEKVRDQGYGRNITYSKKVFIPLTQLCRDVATTVHFPNHQEIYKRLFFLRKRFSK